MMGKLLIFPGVDLFPPSRNQLVERATEIVMKEVLTTFDEQGFTTNNLDVWHRDVRDYFWRQEFKLTNRRFKEEDVKRWKAVWRNTALEYIRGKRMR
jgi:hypothetical protein